MGNNIVRKSVFFIVTIVVTGYLVTYWWYTPELRDRVSDHPWQSVSLLILGVVSVALLVWGIVRPSSWKVLLSFGLGFAAALWGMELLEGIAWLQIGIIAGCIAILVVLWVLTILDTENTHTWRQRLQAAQPAPQAPGWHPHPHMAPPPPPPGQNVAPPPPPGTVAAPTT